LPERAVKTLITDGSVFGEQANWHWTYYMFREREWSAMDYELGPTLRPADRSASAPGMKVILKALKIGGARKKTGDRLLPTGKTQTAGISNSD